MEMNLEMLKSKMDETGYIYDDTIATTLLVALKLGRPLLIEGAAGVGKTEIAKVMAHALDRELVRMQCYEGLDESKALYEWNYQKQLLAIQVNMNDNNKEVNSDELTKSLFGDEYLLERPLLKSIRSEEPVVLLIDEIDKSDEEFEAFLLELLSDMQVSIPETGTIKAKSIPFVVLTSNRARPLSEALRRRCAYLYIQYPEIEKEVAIINSKLPHVNDRLALQVAQAIHNLRENENILKKPSIAETLDWVSALDALGVREMSPEAMRQTMGFVLKNQEDQDEAVADPRFGIDMLIAQETGHGPGHGHGHHHGHGHGHAHGHHCGHHGEGGHEHCGHHHENGACSGNCDECDQTDCEYRKNQSAAGNVEPEKEFDEAELKIEIAQKREAQRKEQEQEKREHYRTLKNTR